MNVVDLPEDVAALIGVEKYANVSGVVEAGAIRAYAAAIEDPNPLYWSETPIAPPALLSAWNRPLPWAPGGEELTRALELHFQIKERLNLPRAVVATAETVLHAPIKAGDRVRSAQKLLNIEPLTARKVGVGRYWTIEVSYRCAATGKSFGVETLRFFAYSPKEPA